MIYVYVNYEHLIFSPNAEDGSSALEQNVCTTTSSTPEKHLNNRSLSILDVCLHSWFMAFCWALLWKLYFPQLLCFPSLHRQPDREGEDPTERRVLQKDPQPCQWGGQSDGEPIGEKHAIHHSTHCYVVIEHQLESSKYILRPLKVCAC